jgi:ribonuclease E
MVKRMLIDAAHPEETRVVVLNGHRLEEFDYETSTKKQIKGNIYLAKVTRVEPSLQAAFVEYGGNRHGFLAFGEIHPDYYRIPVADRQAALEAQRVAEAEADEDEERHAEFDTADDDGEVDEVGVATLPDHLPEMAEADVLRGPDAGEPNVAEEWHDEAPHEEEPDEEEPPQAAESPLTTEPDDFATSFAPPSPEGDAFAEDDAVQNFMSENTGGDQAAPDTAAEIIAPSEETELHAGAATPEAGLEIVGGDEIEETVRRRARPYRHYKIQEVIKRRQIMLVQVTKEERGNKGAALTTYISLAGRYCVLMPNTPRGGGVSRKITSMTDRRRLKDLVGDLEVPEGMGVIVRTAGSERSKPEIKRDFEYLLRLWDEIRELTLKSTAPALIYEEGNLIKRAIRDLYSRDIDEVLVDGRDGYDTAKSFMRMLMPSHTKRVKFYNDPSIPLFHRFQVEGQIDVIHSPVVQLRSGGYLVINPTEALVAIDVNSGRSTRERNIEETALKTNLEAADEVARQLRLRDLAGLIVIDFIDMEERRNNGAVERRVKEAMRYDRARIQLGRISPFGLLELSRQRLRPSLLEASTQPCPHCNGTGHIRSTESTALHVLRAIEEEGMRRRSAEVTVAVPTAVALYILNQKRTTLQQAEARYGFHVTVAEDNALVPPAFRLDRVRALTPAEIAALPVLQPLPMPAEEEAANAAELEAEEEEIEQVLAPETGTAEIEALDEESWGGTPSEASGGAAWGETGEGGETPPPSAGRGRRRRRHRRRGGDRHRETAEPNLAPPNEEIGAESGEVFATAKEEGASELDFGGIPAEEPDATEHGESGERKRRRRGRRGGRRRRHGRSGEGGPMSGIEPSDDANRRAASRHAGARAELCGRAGVAGGGGAGTCCPAAGRSRACADRL